MDIKSLATETFTPKFNGNKELPANEQVTVDLYLPGLEEYEKYVDKEGPDAIGLSKLCIKKLANLKENGVEIVDGKQLVKCRAGIMRDLIIEITAEIILRNRLTAEQEKNSGAPSSSS